MAFAIGAGVAAAAGAVTEQPCGTHGVPCSSVQLDASDECDRTSRGTDGTHEITRGHLENTVLKP